LAGGEEYAGGIVAAQDDARVGSFWHAALEERQKAPRALLVITGQVSLAVVVVCVKDNDAEAFGRGAFGDGEHAGAAP
jgi:hypothetical protein